MILFDVNVKCNIFTDKFETENMFQNYHKNIIVFCMTFTTFIDTIVKR